ncbi:MAG: hypothetical protein SH807_00690 [Blastochloris sp.]|jgi:uncharacterized membrane protein|nr:hypothetical protein [Blastochloris sp.]
MNTKLLVGIALIVLGVIALSYQAITYTKREKVVDIGALQITADTQKKIPLPPIAGGLLIAGGVAVIVMGRRS